MKNYDFRCDNGHVFEVMYDQEFHRDDRWQCPLCSSPAEWAPSINIGAFSAKLWTGEAIAGVDSTTSLRQWEEEHVPYDPANEDYAKRKLKERLSAKDETVKESVRHHVRNLMRIKEPEQRSNYVRDHKPEPVSAA